MSRGRCTAASFEGSKVLGASGKKRSERRDNELGAKENLVPVSQVIVLTVTYGVETWGLREA